MPAIVRGATGGKRILQLPSGHACLAILGREDHGSVATDDLSLGIPNEPLGAEIPGGDHALKIQRKNGEIGRAFDDRLQEIPTRWAWYFHVHLDLCSAGLLDNSRGESPSS